MATQQGGKKKGKKARTLNLQEFLSGSGGDPNLGKNVSVVRAVKEVGGGTNWADEMEAFDTVEIQTLVLPSAPKASRGPDIDMADLPDHPPYTVYVANLPYDSCEDDLKNFFRELNVIGVRLQKDNNERLKGFGYVDFGDRESIIEALSMHETTLRTRALRITLSNADNERGQRRGGDRYGGERDRDRTRNPDEPDRTTGDWRAGREKPAMDERGPGGGGSSFGSRNGPDNESRDTYSARGNRDRGFGDRDRGFGSGFSDRGGDRESRGGFGGDRESRGGFGGDRDSRGGGGFGGDRESRGGGGFGGDRDSRGGGGFGGDREQRSGFGGDRGFDRDRGNRDRGFGGDRERDRGYERSRDSFGGSSFDSRGGRGGTGGRYEESSGFGRGGGARRRDDREGGYQRDERYSRPFSRGNSRDRADVGGERSERAERSERPPRPTTPAGPTEDSVDSGARDVEHEQKHEKAAEPERPKERPRLKLLPRSKPAEEAAGADQTPSIFGGARPVDTAAREREIEEKLRREEDDKRRAQQDRPQQRGRRSGQYDEESGDGRTSRGAWQRSDRSEDEHHPASESHEGHDDPRPRRPLSRHHDDEESHDEEHTMTEKRADSPPTPPTARVEAVPTENYWAKRQQQPAARSHSSASVEVSLDTPMSPEPRDERPEGDLEQPQRSEWHSSERRGGRDRDEASGPPRRGREWEDAGPPRGRDRDEGGPPRGRDRDDTGPTRGRGGVRLGRGGGRGGGPARRVNSREGPGYIGAPSKSPGPSSEDEKKGRAGSIDDKEPLGRKTSNVSLPPPRKETVNVVPAPPPAVNVWQKRQEINKPKPQEVSEPPAVAVPAVTPVQAEPAAPAPVPVAPQLEEKQPEKKVESIQREAAPPPVAQQQPPQQPASAPQPPRNRGWEGRPLSAEANRAWGSNPQQPSSNGAPGAGPAGDTVVSSTRRLSANPPPPAGKLGFGRGSKLQATAPAGPIVGVGSAPTPTVSVAASVATAPSAPAGVLAPTPVAVPAAPTGVWGRPNKIRQMADEAAAKEKTATANKFAGLATTDSEESVGQ